MELINSRKLREKIGSFRYAGLFTQKEAEAKGMRLVIGQEKKLRIYWLVDESDGVIADIKFQAFGPMALLSAAEVACELVLRKNYYQASRLSADLIDRHVRDKKEIPAFPPQCDSFLNQVISALDAAAEQCQGLPYVSDYDTTPIERDFETIEGGIPDWEQFSLEKKKHFIEEVIEKEIRPYIELDAGGVQVLELKEDGEILISYQGSCTTCHSATGSTLSAIQQILKARLHPSLRVTPHF